MNSLAERLRDQEGKSGSVLKFSLKRAEEWFEKWCVEQTWERQRRVREQGQGKHLQIDGLHQPASFLLSAAQLQGSLSWVINILCRDFVDYPIFLFMKMKVQCFMEF